MSHRAVALPTLRGGRVLHESARNQGVVAIFSTVP